jgi:hypothetical protein
MVKWENDKNVYILGAALAALNASITNEIAESVIAGWRKFSFSFLLLLLSRLDHNFCLLFPRSLLSFFLLAYLTHLFKTLCFRGILLIPTIATTTLGEAPTLRAVRDQIKKLSFSSSSATTTTTAATAKKSRGKKARASAAAKGKGKSTKGKKRVRDDDSNDEEQAEHEEQGEDDGDEEGPAKKQKVVVKQEEVDGDDDADEEV